MTIIGGRTNGTGGLNLFWLGCFYSGAASASATGAAGGSDLVSIGSAGLLSVSMGSSVGWEH